MDKLGDIFARAADSVFGTGQRAPVFPQIPPQPVTLQQAIEIFDRIAAMKDLGFDAPHEGCFARAHLSLRRMFGMGLTPKKAWAFEPSGGSLKVRLEDGRKAVWWAHVAPALPVRMPDGRVTDLVLDPSLFDGPVSLKEWGRAMEAKDDQLMFAEAGSAPRGHHGDYNGWGRTDQKTDSRAASEIAESFAEDPGYKLLRHRSSLRPVLAGAQLFAKPQTLPR
ncbi:MAG TPA: protein-glutamine glutaminase family protein [Patescibacteria group bacterium]|nr:protein-glutamine glutaminase family protein [Patescibacteria group bacterium]